MARVADRQLHHRVVTTSVGPVTVVVGPSGITHVFLPGNGPADDGLDTTDDPDHPVSGRAERQLAEYFAGHRRTFDLPLDLRPNETSAFERATWLALADIPYGETISYAEQARRIGRPGAQRAVGATNGRNPLPIVLPCHRVIGADGSLVGFGGGLELKRALLELESGVQRLPL